MGGYKYDVFISYSSKDSDWVRNELLPALRRAGLRVCIDFRDFKAGAPGVKEMERCIEKSRKTVLVLTPAYLKSDWTEFESLMLQTLDPANQKRRLIPMLKERCNLPLRLKYLTYLNFVDPYDWNLEWQKLLKALGAPNPSASPPAKPDSNNDSDTGNTFSWFLPHPYPLPDHFTGRGNERKMLNEWLNEDDKHNILVLRALGGFGKSALVWYWLKNDVDMTKWPQIVWWSFYDQREFESFLKATLKYLGMEEVDALPSQQVEALLNRLREPGVLLVLDGFERALRAYNTMMAPYLGDESVSSDEEEHARQRDCISLSAEDFLRKVATYPHLSGKVLITTRLRPRILESPHGDDLLANCREVELEGLSPDDAVAYFRARGIRGNRAEMEVVAERYGYHPLSLALLAGLILKDPRKPGDITVAEGLDVTGDLKQRQHHVLQRAYESLPPDRQRLLGVIACFRGPVEYDALQAVAGEEVDLDAALRDLVARGLVHYDPARGRYDLHPIVRRYAYDRLTGDERTAAHARLRDYFAAVPPPQRVQTLDDLTPVIELYHHTVRAGRYDEAFELLQARLVPTPLYYQFGAYQLIIELLRALFPDGEDRPPRLKSERAQSWAANELANSYSLSGQPARAIPLLQISARLDENANDKKNLAIGLGNLADDQMKIGALRAAEANLSRRIALCREIEDAFDEAIGHQELGRLLAYRGRWTEAEAELDAALGMFEKQKEVQSQGIVWAYRALRALLMARERFSKKRANEALRAARRALELADEDARTTYPVERDYVRAHWLLGAAYRLNGDLPAAERHLNEALRRCRAINMVDHEANILLALARLRHDQGRIKEALNLAEEALIITERSGYVLQGADVHLFLAEIALAEGDKEKAREHALKAHELATCDGPPDYTYKVAYDEAEKLLKILGK